MKKTLLIILCAFLVTQLSCLALEQEKGTIQSQANVSKEFEPQAVVIVLAVETKDKSAKVSAEQNSKISSTVINALKSQINTDKGDYIKTSNYSVSPRYSYVNKISKLDYYLTRNQVTIETTKVDKAGDLIDLAVQNGANKIQNIYFKLKDSKPFCNGLLKQASKEAKAEASDIASSLGVKLSGIKNVSYNCSDSKYMPGFYAKSANLTAEGVQMDSSTPIEASNIKLNASVNIQFYIGE